MVVRPPRARLVFDGVDLAAGLDVVAQLHHVIIKRHAVRAASNVQDIDQSRVIPGNRLEFQNPLELPFKPALVLEILAPDHFHGAQGTGHAAGEPNLAISSAADFPQNFVVWYRGVWANSSRHRFRLRVSPTRA